MSFSDDFQAYKQFERQTFKRSPADIKDRWKSRIVAGNLHIQGRLGAEIFLKKYGRNITEKKAVQWALKSEIEECRDMANVFWEKAYELKLNPPKSRSKKQDNASSKLVSEVINEKEYDSTNVAKKVNFPRSFPEENDTSSLRTWWHSILQTHGKHACCAFILALPGDFKAIEYLDKLGNELNLISKDACLVLALSDTRAITYGVGEDAWRGAIHEQVGNGQSLNLARMFNINFTGLPCMVIFRDIRSPEHLIVSLQKMEVDEISQVMRSVFSIIQSANSKRGNPLAELELHRKKQEFQKLKQSVIGEVRKYLDMTVEAAMQVFFNR